MEKRAFISHISEEMEVAKFLKQALIRDFLRLMTVFVSSDTESIAAGEEWLKSIEKALSDCAMLLILCSPESVKRPWINFEAGAAWLRKIPLIPICHAGLTPRDLPMPLSLRQAIGLEDPVGLTRLYAQIAQIIGCAVPQRNFEELASELGKSHVEPQAHDKSLENDRAIRSRLCDALNHPEVKWRSLKALASEAGISVEQAANLLHSDDSVRFSTGKSGDPIVGLKSRVGEVRRFRAL